MNTNFKKSSFTMFLDAPNLYSHAMSQRLPTKGFRSFSDEDINSFNIQEILEENNDGSVLETDVHYP